MIPMITNAKFAKENKQFQIACSKAGISPTKRQASRFRAGRGLAYQNR